MYVECIDCGLRSDKCRCKAPVFRIVFEHAPKPIPPLTEEQWEFINRPLTEEEKKK